MIDNTMMSLFKLTPRAVWRTRIRYRFDGVHRRIRHGLSSGIRHSSLPVVPSVECPVYYSADQCLTRPVQCRIKIYIPDQFSVRKLSSSRKPLVFTDDLLQKHIKQLIAEWNQTQKQLTCDKSDGGQLSAQHTSKRLSFLEPIVSKVMQHEQYSADISELEDIMSGMSPFMF